MIIPERRPPRRRGKPPCPGISYISGPYSSQPVADGDWSPLISRNEWPNQGDQSQKYRRFGMVNSVTLARGLGLNGTRQDQGKRACPVQWPPCVCLRSIDPFHPTNLCSGFACFIRLPFGRGMARCVPVPYSIILSSTMQKRC